VLTLGLFDVVESWNSRAIFVTQRGMNYIEHKGEMYFMFGGKISPSLTTNNHDDYIMMSLINKATMEVCQARGGICIDLAKELAVAPEDYYDVRHMNPQGTEKVGNFLYNKLKTLF